VTTGFAALQAVPHEVEVDVDPWVLRARREKALRKKATDIAWHVDQLDRAAMPACEPSPLRDPRLLRNWCARARCCRTRSNACSSVRQPAWAATRPSSDTAARSSSLELVPHRHDRPAAAATRMHCIIKKATY
jgi:hypothetical protein